MITICDSDSAALEIMARVFAPVTSDLDLTYETDPALIGAVTLIRTSGKKREFIKPVRIGQILEYIQELSAQSQGPDSFGPYRFDAKRRVLEREHGGPVALTDREAGILQYLLQADGAVVGRDDLLRDVWGYRETLETHTLETHIYRLRQKIEEDPSAPAYLITKENGYSLVL